MAKQKPFVKKNNQKQSSVKQTPIAKNNSEETTFFKKNHFLIIGLLFALAFAVYYPTLKYGFVMDDGAVITDNKTVKKGTEAIIQLFKESSVYGSTGENFGTYRPLVMAMFAWEYSIAKGSPYLYHFFNVFFYALCCVVVYHTLTKFLRNYHPFIPLIAVVLFIVHPVHTEVVANIKSRDEILSMLFLFASAGNLFTYFEKQKTINYVWSILLFTLALFSKESSVTFLFIIPLMFYFFTEVSVKNVLLKMWPFFAGLIIYLLARNAVLDPITSNMPIINNALVGAKNGIEKYATIAYIMFLYLRNLVATGHLSFDYGYAQVIVQSIKNPIVIITLLMFAWFFIYTIWKFKSRNLWVFCILFYVATLSVSSNVVIMIAATMADRFLFVPSLGFTLAIAGGVVSLFRLPLTNTKTLKWVALTPVAVIALYWANATEHRNPVWTSNYTLFQSGTIDAPNSYRTNRAFAVENLVSFQKDTTRPALKEMYKKEMLVYYRKAMAIYPKLADDCFNMAICYYYHNNLDSAKIWYLNCLNINNNYLNAHYNVAMIFSNEKNHEQAIKYFLEVHRLNPDFMETNFKIGLHYHYQNKFAEAIPYYEQFFTTHPTNTDVITNLSLAHLGLGHNDKYQYYQQELAKVRATQKK